VHNVKFNEKKKIEKRKKGKQKNKKREIFFMERMAKKRFQRVCHFFTFNQTKKKIAWG